MGKDQTIGWSLLAVSVIMIVVYSWLLWFPPSEAIALFLLKLTGWVAVLAVFGVLGWIGYTLATTPPPKPVEEIEKELEEELKKLEKETSEETGETVEGKSQEKTGSEE